MTDRERELEQAQAKISNRISGIYFALIGVLSLVVAVALVASSGGDQTQSAARPAMMVTPSQTVTVAMRDPGCHWFQVGQDYQKSMSITGPVSLLNSDEAALRIVGPDGVQVDNVGQHVSLVPGSYRITMIGQEPDDNILHLSVS